jgi:hypothetical protein
VFEVKWYKGERLRDRDGGLSEHCALTLLRGGEVDLKDAEMWKGIAVAEGVETRAEDNILTNAARDGEGELILSEAAARNHVSAESASDGVGFAGRIKCETVAEQRDGDGIGEDARLIDDLVNGAPVSHAESGSAGAAMLHEDEFKRPEKFLFGLAGSLLFTSSRRRVC